MSSIIKEFKQYLIKEHYLNESDRCTNVTLRAFGICVDEPIIYGAGVIEYLTNNGFTVKVHDFDYFKYNKKPLKKFIQDHPKGSYIISTRNHSMALIDGKLYDAAEGGLNRKVLYAYEVIKNK